MFCIMIYTVQSTRIMMIFFINYFIDSSHCLYSPPTAQYIIFLFSIRNFECLEIYNILIQGI